MPKPQIYYSDSMIAETNKLSKRGEAVAYENFDWPLKLILNPLTKKRESPLK